MIKELEDKVLEATKAAGYQLPEVFDFSPTKNEKFGDCSTNIAMQIAAESGEEPKKIAENIISKIKSDDFASVEIAGGGFINFFLSKKYFVSALSEVLSEGENYGKSDIGKGKKALVEFISANPTGPLHIGNARGGPIGEVLSNVLSWQGYKVEKEFYVNDTGNQIIKFGQTLAYWYLRKKDDKLPFPEGGYPGEFLQQVSDEIQQEQKSEIEKLTDGELVEFFARHGLDKTIRRIKDDVEKLGISFDEWVYESDYINAGESLKVVEKLKVDGHTNEREGALWFTSNDLDPNDRETVLLRSDSDKTPTYFATDIAYHKDKFDRGYSRMIDIWGPGHHGHIPRVKSAMKLLGYDANKLEIFLYQNVKLKKDGKAVQMGKRLGNFINIADLIDKLNIPADIFKYMIISQSPSSLIDFDLELAKEQSEKNPVYYLQYAYARICSVLRKVQAEELSEVEKIAKGEKGTSEADLEILSDKKELKLIGSLTQLPEVLNKISTDFQIQALPHFATEVAREYHNFYSTCQILSEDKKQTRARLLLILATRNVLKISLTLMGISAPESM